MTVEDFLATPVLKRLLENYDNRKQKQWEKEVRLRIINDLNQPKNEENQILKDLRYAETPAQKDKFFNELTEFRKKQADQELEDAAKSEFPIMYSDSYIETMGGDYKKAMLAMNNVQICRQEGFKAGANWKAEQVATDTIEFAEWCSSTHYRYDPIYKTWRYDADSYTSKELYELWQKETSKKKS